jgi:hypothetical protein
MDKLHFGLSSFLNTVNPWLSGIQAPGIIIKLANIFYALI